MGRNIHICKTVSLSEKLYDKLEMIADERNITVHRFIVLSILKAVEEYDSEHGNKKMMMEENEEE